MIPTVDYDKHPAFSPFCKRASATDNCVGLNKITEETVNEFILTGRRHTNLIEKNIARYDEILRADKGIDDRLREPLATAFRAAHDMLVEEKSARATVGPADGATANVRTESESLYNEGFFLRDLPADQVARIQELYAGEIEALRTKASALSAEGGIKTINYAFPDIPEAKDIVQQYCERTGVYDAISAFYGAPYDHFDFVLHHSSPTEDWMRVFDDIGMAPAKTLSLHFDAAFARPKAMLYLNDVGASNGAFSLIPRESPFENIEFDLAFGKAILKQLPAIAKKEFGYSQTGNESIFRCIPMRALYASLPHSLRQTCNIGDHLLDGSPESDGLMRKELVLEGSAGHMPIFLGSHTMHRGGFVRSGERVAMQIIFCPKQEEEPIALQQQPAKPSFWRRLRGVRPH